MTAALDPQQGLMEIEQALSKSFPYPSTKITHVTDSEDVVTIQVSWVASAADLSILDSRCALNLVLEPDVLGRYCVLDGAARLRVKESLRAMAEDAWRERTRDGGEDLAECNLMVGVSVAAVDSAAKGLAT
jgi:hypothetical protein